MHLGLEFCGNQNCIYIGIITFLPDFFRDFFVFAAVVVVFLCFLCRHFALTSQTFYSELFFFLFRFTKKKLFNSFVFHSEMQIIIVMDCCLFHFSIMTFPPTKQETKRDKNRIDGSGIAHNRKREIIILINFM